jgi:hypothetical protein
LTKIKKKLAKLIIYIEIRKEKNRRDEKVLLRNQATIAQVITEPNVWLLNRWLELEKMTYATFYS